MDKTEVQILLIEDDPSLKQVLQHALTDEGYQVHSFSSANQAAGVLSTHQFQLALIDCMLPGQNGVDFAHELVSRYQKTLNENPIKVILMSGVFKDKIFRTTALQRTQAEEFLIKPFDLDHLLNLVQTALKPILDFTPQGFDSFLAGQSSPKQLLKALDAPVEVHAFELPLILSLLFEIKASGRLKIQATQAYSIGLIDGEIHEVSFQDKTSYFGTLLVENGFTTMEEVESALSQKSPLRMGERLVNSLSLSPHAIELVEKEQRKIRMSKMIQDETILVSFVNEPVSESLWSLNFGQLVSYMSDWSQSKFSLSWLQSFYWPWLDLKYILAKNEDLQGASNRLEVFKKVAPLFNKLNRHNSLHEVLNNIDPEDHENFYRDLHFLTLTQQIQFSLDSKQEVDFEKKIAWLHEVYKDLSKKNYFEIFGVTEFTSTKAIHKNYLNLAKNFHPDKLPPNSSQELNKINTEIFTLLQQAFETLRDDTKKQAYRKSLSTESVEDILSSEHIYKSALSLMSYSKYKEALPKLEEVAKVNSNRYQLRIYLLWAHLKVNPPLLDDKPGWTQLENLFRKIPPEERHSAEYFFVKALLYKKLQQPSKAVTNFNKSLALNGSFIAAKRELSSMKQDLKKSLSIKSLFRKKS